jgi:hypothetical protein
MSPEKTFVCNETYSERYMRLKSYEQEGKWIVLSGEDARTGENFEATFKIWDELMPVCKRDGFKRAGKHQYINTLVDRAVLILRHNVGYSDYTLCSAMLYWAAEDDDESVWRFNMCSKCLEAHDECPLLDEDVEYHSMILESCKFSVETRNYTFRGTDCVTKETCVVVLDEQTAKGGILKNSSASEYKTLNDLQYHYDSTDKIGITFMICPEFDMVRIVALFDSR